MEVCRDSISSRAVLSRGKPQSVGGKSRQLGISRGVTEARLVLAAGVSDMSEVWFCGVEAAWTFFAAPLLPTKCYFSATLTRSELEKAGVTVWDNKADCACIPMPPPPSSPPSEIYFCGLPAVQRFFEETLNPTQCYFSYKLTRIQVMSEGVDVFPSLDACHCTSPPPPLPRPPQPPAIPPQPPAAPFSPAASPPPLPSPCQDAACPAGAAVSAEAGAAPVAEADAAPVAAEPDTAHAEPGSGAAAEPASSAATEPAASLRDAGARTLPRVGMAFLVSSAMLVLLLHRRAARAVPAIAPAALPVDESSAVWGGANGGARAVRAQLTGYELL